MTQRRSENDWNGLALIAGAFLLVTLGVGGYYIGMLVDRHIGSSPTGAIVGLLLGTFFGIWDLYRVASRILRQQPVPTREQQEAARANWEASANNENTEGDRENPHE